MLRFQSPLPRNYHQIVRIYTEPVEVVNECPPMVRDDPWIDPGLLIKETVADSTPVVIPTPVVPPIPIVIPTTVVPPTLPRLPSIEEEPQAPQVNPPKEPQLEKLPEMIGFQTMAHSTLAGVPVVGSPVDASPFSVKPVITSMMDEKQLIQANPALDDSYIERREQMLKSREAVTAETKEDVKVDVKEDEPVPQEFIDRQRQLFEEQQAALRALRTQSASTVSETKQKVDVEQPLPPPNMRDPVKTVMRQPRKPLSEGKHAESKLLAEVVQSLPPANVVQNVDSLRVDQLKQLCMKRGLTTKGNKPDLIARLKQVGIETVTF